MAINTAAQGARTNPCLTFKLECKVQIYDFAEVLLSPGADGYVSWAMAYVILILKLFICYL
jgi:hypothetical protein